MWPFRKKIKFEKVAKFNYQLDQNEKIKQEITKLSLSKTTLDREKYVKKLLALFKAEGIDLTVKEFDMLLLLRSKMDQMKIENEKNDTSVL